MTRRTFASFFPLAALAARERDFLSKGWPPGKLRASLIPRAEWKPYPGIEDRAAWDALPPDLRKAVLAEGERYLGQPWPPLPATVFLDYKRNGNRSNYERLSRPRRTRVQALALAECVENKGRFLDEILNGVWFICEESFWGVPAHLGAQKAGPGLPDTAEPIVDLFAAETGALLAWTDYLLGPRLNRLSPLVQPRLNREVRRRILEPCATRDDFGWMGFGSQRSLNNWTPWIDSNWLYCALLMETDEAARVTAVSRILRSLDAFLNGYHDDGGCDEGPGYWGRAAASLFDNLEMLKSASRGAIDFYAHPLIGEMGRFIYRTHIAGEWHVNFADASARVRPAGSLVYRYGARIGDPAMQAHGAWLLKQGDRIYPFSDCLGRELPAVFTYAGIAQAPARPALPAEAWMPGIQVLTARRAAGSTEGLFLAAQGGHNAESHNHNDAGNFIVFANGQPALIDVGVETYTAKTFSSRRYEIWTMQSAWHNCPTIGGVQQSPGREFAARDVSFQSTPSQAVLRMDLAGAYPPEAACTRWMRQWRFSRPSNTIELTDEYTLAGSGRPLELNFIVPVAPVVTPGKVAIGNRLILTHEPAWTATIDTHESTDDRLQPIWGKQVWRIRLILPAAPAQGRSRVLIAQA
jgi:hypothetical protein